MIFVRFKSIDNLIYILQLSNTVLDQTICKLLVHLKLFKTYPRKMNNVSNHICRNQIKHEDQFKIFLYNFAVTNCPLLKNSISQIYSTISFNLQVSWFYKNNLLISVINIKYKLLL